MATIVRAGPTDSNDQIIRKFKKKVQVEDVLTEIKKREFYKKPSVQRKEKLQELRRKKHSNN
jgi:small subunit ribosomal protein S21